MRDSRIDLFWTFGHESFPKIYPDISSYIAAPRHRCQDLNSFFRRPRHSFAVLKLIIASDSRLPYSVLSIARTPIILPVASDFCRCVSKEGILRRGSANEMLAAALRITITVGPLLVRPSRSSHPDLAKDGPHRIAQWLLAGCRSPNSDHAPRSVKWVCTC